MEDVSSQKSLVCLDKSFARAVGRQRLSMLSNKWDFLVPSAFYFEVFDPDGNDEPERAKERQIDRQHTLSGIASFRRIYLPNLLQSETISGKPCQETTSVTLSVNPRVLEDDWMLAPDELEVIERYRKKTVEEGVNFWKAVVRGGEIGEAVVPSFGSEELAAARGAESDFIDVCLLLRDENVIRRIAKASGFRHAHQMDTRWLHFRQFQAWALHGLVLWRRCQHAGGVVSEYWLEHDLQDLEYLILGMHAGCLATNDISRVLKKASLGWRFVTLHPLGHLVNPASIRVD